MKFLKIKEQLQSLRVFSLNDIYLVDPNFRQATLYDWENKGYVKKICNRWYVFNGFRPMGNDYYLIANRIYPPSYISLELALNHYGIIPESVLQITSVTTRKTKTFSTEFGSFNYRSIKNELFFGYTILEHENFGIKIACLEKAILDYFYFNFNIVKIEDIEGLRFNKEILRDELKRKVLDNFLKIFNSKSLSRRIAVLRDYIKN